MGGGGVVKQEKNGKKGIVGQTYSERDLGMKMCLRMGEVGTMWEK